MLKRFAVHVVLCSAALCMATSDSVAQPNEFHYGGQLGLTEGRLTDLSGLMYTFSVETFRGNPVTATGGTTSFNPGVAFGGWGYYVINPNFGLQLGIFSASRVARCDRAALNL